jgi:hypothetical protein
MPMKSKRLNMKEDNELFILPSSNDEMRSFANTFKVDLMEQVVGSIEHALTNDQKVIEVFQFKNSNFVITISEKEFESNLENIHDYYMSHELYELVPRVVKLREILKHKTNEKETPEKGSGSPRPSNSE